MPNTYSPQAAARFLGVTLEHLEQLTREGSLRPQQARVRGERHYLGGELDLLKGSFKKPKIADKKWKWFDE